MTATPDRSPSSVVERVQTPSSADGLVRPSTRWKRVQRALAYDVWNYTKPNEQAVEGAGHHIARVREAAKAAGYRLVLEPEDQ